MTGRRVAISTQEKYPWKAVLRTVVQAVVALALSAPLIVAAITGDSAEAAGGALALFLAVSAAITRLMAVPVVNDWLAVVGLGSAPKNKTNTGNLHISGHIMSDPLPESPNTDATP